MSQSPGANKLQARARAVVSPVATRLWTSTGSATTGCPVDGPAILCPNHISFLDSAFLMLTLPRNISFVGKAEYLDSWKTALPVPGDGHDPDRPVGWQQEPGGARRRRAGAAARRAVRHLPRGHPQPRRLPLQGPHRGRPTGDADRVPDLPGRDHRHRRDPAARRQVPEAAAASARSRSAGRSGPSATPAAGPSTWPGVR